METAVIETKSGSPYKVEKTSKGWFIYAKEGRCPIVGLSQKKISEVKTVREFKGRLILYQSREEGIETNTNKVENIFVKRD